MTSPQAEWQALGDGYRVGVHIVALSEAKRGAGAMRRGTVAR